MDVGHHRRVTDVEHPSAILARFHKYSMLPSASNAAPHTACRAAKLPRPQSFPASLHQATPSSEHRRSVSVTSAISVAMTRYSRLLSNVGRDGRGLRACPIHQCRFHFRVLHTRPSTMPDYTLYELSPAGGMANRFSPFVWRTKSDLA